MKCPSCNSEVPLSQNYCNECGAEMPNSTKSFVYDQLFELMKMENERRLQLDSKASTYIGLLSIAVTIFGALGGLLTFENVRLFKIPIFYIILFLYMTTIFVFVVGILIAFKAYHQGSQEIRDTRDNAKMKELIDSGKAYLKLNSGKVRNLINEQSQITKNDIISDLIEIIDVNRNINIEKSNGILWSFRVTIFAIILLLIMTIFIGIISIDVVR